MSSAWILWLALCWLGFGNVSNGAQSDLLMSSTLVAIRNGATVVSRFLNPQASTFFAALFQKLSEKLGKRDEGNSGTGENELIRIMLRLMGIDSRKVTDLAFSGMISIVLLISQIFLKEEEKRRKQRKAPRNFSLFRFILNQPQVARLLTQMQDPNLMAYLLEELETPEKDVDCIKLLLCRTKPFVRGMQRSLKFFLKREKMEISENEETCCKDDEETAWEAASLEDRMYFFAPSMKEVVESGDECDQLFPNCHY